MPIQVRAKQKKRDEFSAIEEAEQTEKLTEIPDDGELLRILRLPRRDIPDPDSPEAIKLAGFLTQHLAKVPLDQLYPGPLMATQALALREGKVCKGLWAPIVVGGGKRLTCFLLATLYLKAGYTNVVYVHRGAEREDVKREFELFRKSWHGPTELQLRCITYEDIRQPGNAEVLDANGRLVKPSLLDRIQPQVMIFDEIHELGNAGAAGTKRVRHYLARKPETICMGLTGTPYRDSLADAAHLMEWCLKENSPLPRPSVAWKTLQAWCGYLDAKPGGALGRTEVGALRRYCELYDSPLDTYNSDAEVQREVIQGIRRLVAQRILETPGVIGTRDAPLDVPLTMDPWYPLEDNFDVSQTYHEMVKTEKLPDGTELPDPLALTRNLSTTGYNFWSKWLPEPPEEWRQARNAWSKWCRRALKYNKHRLTSEATVKAAIRRGLYQETGKKLLEAWEAADKAYREETGLREPPSVPQWLGDGTEVVASVREWVRQYGGLVWVQHIGLGDLLSAQLGIPYYGAGGGFDKNTKRNIIHHPGGPAIASLDACGTGKNLQHLWSDALWLCVPGEQALARIHRRGQKASVVRNFYYIGCAPHLDSYERAKEVKAAFHQDMMLSPQKLMYLQDEGMPSCWELERRGGTRWEPRP